MRTIPKDTATDDGTPSMGFASWVGRLFSGRPHFYIGGTQRPYLLRWYLLCRRRRRLRLLRLLLRLHVVAASVTWLLLLLLLWLLLLKSAA